MWHPRPVRSSQIGPPDQPGPSHPNDASIAYVSGRAILDLSRTDRAVITEFEPMVDVRAATEWGGLMDGTIELRDEGVVWVPGENAQRFGFIEFHVPTEDVIDIRVSDKPRASGEIDIDLTDHRKVVVRVPDPDRWQSELDRVIGL